MEILVNFETANRYAVLDEHNGLLGMIAERAGGVGETLKRLLFRSHRGFTADVFENDGRHILSLSRRFFLFFSDLFIVDATTGATLGSVHRRFAFLHKRYDLKTADGNLFAVVNSPIWRLWTFPVKHVLGKVHNAVIAKKWSGVSEVFTDADTFLIDFGEGQFSPPQRAVVLGAAISIDFDFFEENSAFSGVFSNI